MADVDRKPIVSIDAQYFPPGETLERPPADRPKHDTIDAIIEWLGGPAGKIPTLIEEFAEFAWRMLAAGFPLLRAPFHLRTLHAQFLGATFVGCGTPGQPAETFVPHEAQDLYGHED